jgi:hypothetical protein
MALRKGLEQRAREDRKGGVIDKEMLKALRRGWCFGSEEFRAALLDRLDGGAGKGDGMARMHDEREAERLVKEGLAALAQEDQSGQDTQGKRGESRAGELAGALAGGGEAGAGLLFVHGRGLTN